MLGTFDFARESYDLLRDSRKWGSGSLHRHRDWLAQLRGRRNDAGGAIACVKQRFIARLKQVEIVPIEVTSPPMDLTMDNPDHPWARFAGMVQANPLFDEVLDSIQAYRRTIDEDESVI